MTQYAANTSKMANAANTSFPVRREGFIEGVDGNDGAPTTFPQVAVLNSLSASS